MAQIYLMVLEDSGDHKAGEIITIDETPGLRLLLLYPDQYRELTWGEAKDLVGPPADRMMRRMVTK
jgi:hypothetical protein